MRCAVDRTIAALALALAACDTSAAEPGDDESSSGDETGAAIEWMSLAERPCPEGSALTWESFGGPFVLSYCATCHGSGLPADMRQNAPVGVDFERVEQVRMHADRMWARAADQNATMPPAGAPGEAERARFGEWLACGAPTDADLGE